MKLSILFASAALAAAPLVVSRADAQAPVARSAAVDSVGALLPRGTFRVDVMDLTASPRLVELNGRLQAAMKADPAWFQQAVARSTPGEALPYDAKLGLTQAEYAEYLRLARGMTLGKVAEAPLSVRAEGTRLVLEGGTAFPDLTGIALDLASDALTTPFGVIQGSREVHSDGGGALGAWDGRTWSLEEGSTESGNLRSAELSLGRMRESGRAVLYWQLGEMRDGRPVQRMVRILFFDPPR